MRTLSLIFIIALLQACATSTLSEQTGDVATEERAMVICDASSSEIDLEMGRLLDHQVELPVQSRIAIIDISHDTFGRSGPGELSSLNDALSESLIQRLESSSRVYDAAFMPQMVVPDLGLLSALREVAARAQADLMLVYRSSCHSDEKVRLLSADEARSWCAVEAIVLDVRSGVLMKSANTRERFDIVQQAGDRDFDQTIKRAELAALTVALDDVADQVLGDIDSAPLRFDPQKDVSRPASF